jgi:hypothetical protein
MVLPAGVSLLALGRADLNPRQGLERPLSLTTRLRERRVSVADPLFEPFAPTGDKRQIPWERYDACDSPRESEERPYPSRRRP